jgi:hypothetical protein
MTRANRYPVAPNAVYVWHGFKAADVDYGKFARLLGGVFVPACALLQPAVGLRAYLPTMVPQEDKPAAVPDQTALMFWATPQSHDLATHSIAVRIYQQLHGGVYDMSRSKSGVPVSITDAPGRLQPDQPYFLVDQPADWMHGSVSHLVGARRLEMSPADFLTQAYQWAAILHREPSPGIDAALVCCVNDYIMAWVHSAQRTGNPAKVLDGLADVTVPVLRQNPRALHITARLWDDWPGLDLTKDACLNIQLRRPPASEAMPRQRARP